MTCRSCGQPVAPTARFCPNCGASQATIDEERRIVTALFADIAGFTGLAEHEDPEEVKHVVDRAFSKLSDEITAFGGVVDKIVGDEIVALFGAPVAHADDAERAVRAGLKMQAAMAELDPELGPPVAIRIGINTGEVLVGSTSAGGDYTAMGDVMNSASRLQELAMPGQVLVGTATKDAAGDGVRFESLGERPARGREGPLEVWLALEPTRPPGVRRRAEPPFVGRTRELAFMEAQAMMAFDLQVAQICTVLGEPGMGKTRLIQEAINRLSDQVDLTLIRGRCVAYGEANVWWAVGELLRELFQLDHNLARAEAAALLETSLTQRFGVASPEISRIVTALLHALGYDTALRGGDRNRNRSEVILAVTQVLEHELAQRAVVVTLADMQWASEAVWSLIDHLLSELARTRLVVMVSAQRVDQLGLRPRRHIGSVMRLVPLAEGESRHLLSKVAGDLPEQAAAALVSRSGGNPFFLEELAAFIADGRAPVPTSTFHTDAESGSDLDELPDTLRGIVAARLDGLEPSQRALIQDASVLGRSGSVIGLKTLVEVRAVDGVSTFDDDLAGLVDEDLLALNGPRYEFRSDLVRDVAYGTLTKTVRAQRHAGIARYLETSQTEPIRNSVVVAIADHFRAAAQLAAEVSQVPGVERDEVVERALYWLEQAGARALAAGASVEAERWYDHGVGLAGERPIGDPMDDDMLARFLFGRAKARCEIHDTVGARADLDRLDPIAVRDPVLAARARLIRGDVDRKAGDLDRAAGGLREAADRLAVLDVPDQQALALRLLGLTEMDRGDDQLATQALTSSRVVASRAGERRSEAWALQSLSWHAFMQGKISAADDLAGQAIEIFAELSDRSGLAWSRGVKAWVAFHRNEWESARELLGVVLPEARRQGDPWAEAMTLNLASSLALWSGRAAEARDLARVAQQVGARAEDHGLITQSMAVEGRAMVSLGQVAAGTELLEQAFLTADRSGDRNARRAAIISNCASAARLGEPERAIRWAARFEGDHEDTSSVGEADLMVSLALALLQRGAVDEAERQLSWSTEAREGSEDRTSGARYEQAVAAIIAAIKERPDEVERSVQQVLTEGSTYLDRVLALCARAASRLRRGDEGGCDVALLAARAEVDPTDDQTTRLLLDLVAALCGRGDLMVAEQRFSGSGLDSAGWRTVWTMAAGRVQPGMTNS